MSKYNYSRAKLITIATTQDVMLYNTRSLSILLNSNVNGVVIFPLPDDKHFTVEDINDDWALEYIDSMILDLVEENPNIKLWVGTPRIDSNSIGKVVFGTGTGSTYRRFQKYIDFFMKKSYKDNIYGIFYNQEAIYGNISLSNPMGNQEAKLMNDVAYYIRDTYEIDMIWAPYYGTGKSDNEANINAEKLAIVANKTTCFDCTFLQTMYIGSRYDLTDTIKNFLPISKSVQNINNLIYKRNAVDTFINKSEKIGNCDIGVEFEYNYKQGDMFNKYIDNYSGLNCPKLLYWQGIVRGDNETSADVRKKVTYMADNIIDKIY